MSETTQDDYNNITYEDLSTEFQALFPKAMRAHQLISLMYDRLTLVDKLSHTQAVKKIHDDHSHLEGFSSRSIRRCLPPDNPAVPHRVRPTWPKKSITQLVNKQMLSINEQCKEKIDQQLIPLFKAKLKIQ